MNNDVALLVLSSSVTPSNNVRIAPMRRTPARVGERLYVSGWGALAEGAAGPNVLNEVDAIVIDKKVCMKSYGLLTDQMLCAGHMDGVYDSCQVCLIFHPIVLPQ